ncbi:hypothetical protein HAX54_029939 [Datura stramonium]|uniref:Kinesin motor domain-containing protein n=1 Tax=Datura stramonium TaxID=4076 RepID=A0ABS8V6S8_DATST|nr:hypothetical protein [Datura stramonium]
MIDKQGSCEHTLNTLRYADRVKSLSKSGNTKKDQSASLISSSVPTLAVSAGAGDAYEQPQESKILATSRRLWRKKVHLVISRTFWWYGKDRGENEVSSLSRGENINEILEEEEALIAAHRKEIEDTMEIVREEMKLLAEVDQPGSRIDNYVTQLSFVLSRKAASLVSLQARLARFQHRLKEQEILSRKRVPR